MSGIVFAGAISHAPHITAFAHLVEKDQLARFHAGAATLRNNLSEARPDVLVVLTSDHFTNIPPGNVPAFCVGTAASYLGPIEDWIKLDKRPIPGHRAFAERLLNAALDGGFDPAFAGQMEMEHGVVVPLHFLTPEMNVPIVPVIQNCMVPPLPRFRRCFAFGGLIRKVAEDSGLRVGVLGTGGLSHAPGAPEAGRIDTEFDAMFLTALEHGDRDFLLDLPSERVDAAGFGTWEVRQWITAMGAAAGAPAEIHTYEPVQVWDTGCAAVSFHLA